MAYNPADLQFVTTDGEIFEPGIHYDMPMETYMSIKALSRSGIKDLLISPLTFWKKSPFNPYREHEENEFAVLGEAHHVRFLEGKDAFEARYAPEFDEDALPDEVLGSGEQLRERCKKLGVAAGGTLAEMSKRIREKETELMALPEGTPARLEALTPLRYFIEQHHLEIFKDKKFIPAGKMRQLEAAARTVENSPDLAPYLRGGRAEVTLLWRDPVFGVPMKARCDYLDLDSTQTWLEFKTFTNIQGMELARAVAYAMANRKYGLQAITSLQGLEALGKPIKRAIFLFQETGDFPNIIPRLFNRTGIDLSENLYWSRAAMDYQMGLHLFADNYSQFGEAPWNPPVDLLAFEDEDFPAWSK